MSLLDMLQGEGGMRLGLGLLAAGGPTTDPNRAGLGARLQQGVGYYDDWKKQKAAEERAKQVQEFQAFQMEQTKAQMMKQAAAEEAAKRQQAAIPGLFRATQTQGSIGIPQRDGVDMFSQGATVEKPSMRGPTGFDVQGALALGLTPDMIEKYASLNNIGRQEVKDWQDIEGPNGTKIRQAVDRFGQPVGSGFSGYVAPVQVNQGGGGITFAKPIAGQNFPVTMTATERDASARGWANNATTIRGQDMTDARARDLNDITRGEKKKVEDLTKGGQIASFDTMLGTLNRLGEHPGLSRSVGIVGAFPTVPGSESANFKAELDTFQSQAFIPMVAQLKGMGALSDAEGKKLTAAVGALNPNMGEKAFRESIARITSEMEAARARVSGEPTPKKEANLMDALPSPVQHKNKTIRDTTTGKLLTSNGMQWVEAK